VKVRVVITLDIDPETWATEYGVTGARDIREDVVRWADNALQSHASDLGLLTERNYTDASRS
jgi:hypothetical protein